MSALGQSLQSRWTSLRQRMRQRRLVKEFAARRKGLAPDLKQVMFVCYGNICRSAFADAYWNEKRGALAQALSAGFHPEIDRPTPPHIAKLAKEMGTDLDLHRSSAIDSDMVARASAIFVMDGKNLEDLRDAFPTALERTWLLGSFSGVNTIRDPLMLPEPEAAESLLQIRRSIDAIVTAHERSA
jgi:protein-tyrosine-phosphatase